MASDSGDMTGNIQAAAAWAPGLLQLRGADCVQFLQGQLSNDIRSLSATAWLLAGLHNPQGRVLALLRLLAPAPDHVVALLPAELAGTIATTLRRYVLRAKVTISADTDTAALAQFAAQSPVATLPAAAATHALDIAAGTPQVYAATSGVFVSQMLNLDCIGAISFDKGCYTGQEIIARTHYRGRMKRRMQRFMSATAVVLAPGQDVLLGDGRCRDARRWPHGISRGGAEARADSNRFGCAQQRRGNCAGTGRHAPRLPAAAAAVRIPGLSVAPPLAGPPAVGSAIQPAGSPRHRPGRRGSQEQR
jgi:folate-binding protein YgfZ